MLYIFSFFKNYKSTEKADDPRLSTGNWCHYGFHRRRLLRTLRSTKLVSNYCSESKRKQKSDYDKKKTRRKNYYYSTT